MRFLFLKTSIKKLVWLVGLLLVPFMGYADDARDKIVTLQLDGVTLKRFFDEIHSQTGVDFIYTPQQARYVEPITVNVTNADLGHVLDNVFRGKGLEYTVEGNIITLRYRRSVEKNTAPVAAKGESKITISGFVEDTSGEPVAGAAVWVKNTKIGVMTASDGRYTVSVPISQGPIELRFTCIGMEPVDVKYRGKDQINVKMSPSTNTLQTTEVVATGMFVRKAESFTGSVSTFNQDQLKRMGTQNVLSSLKNIDPSFVINESVDFGSDPNRMPDIQMRGQNNIPDLKGEYQTAPNQPLFILDGFEATVEKVYDLDMNLVKSVTLLKDAAAKAIYGSKAANGVVVIETIQPEAGRLRIAYTGAVDVTVPDLTSYNLTNASEKLQAEVLAGKYTSGNAYEQARLTQEYNELYREVARGVDSYWMSQPLRTGIGNKHSVYIDGGSEDMRYAVSLGYNHIAGVMKGSDRKTISGSVTLSYRYKTLSFRNQLSIDNNNAKNSPYGSFSNYSKMNPYWRIYNTDGSLIKQYGSDIYNPLLNADLNSKDQTGYTTITENFYGEWEAFKNFRIRARFGLTTQKNSSDIFKPASHTDYASISVNSDDYLLRGEYTKAQGAQMSLSADIGAAYAIEVNKHLLYTNLSWTIEEANSETTSNTAVGFPSDRMDFISFGNGYKVGSKPTGSESTTRSAGLVLSANYSYDNRYLADLSYRLNGSSQFGAEERWGNFWSVGIGWNLHKERFMQAVDFIDYCKLRASLGYTGSQNFNSYQAISTYNYITDRTYNGDMGAILMGIANDNLKWQQQYDRNIGLDLSMINKISLRADLYWATTTNLLSDVTLPPSVGFSTYKENLGETINKGVEVNINYRVFNYSQTRTSLNIFASLAHNINKISKISNALKKVNEEQDASKESSSTTTEDDLRTPSIRFEEGQSLTAIWAVRSAGIDPVTGREIYIKKDGTTTFDWSAADQVVCGDTQPKVNGNIGANFSTYGFDFSFTFTYRLGGQTYNSTLVEKIENADVKNWNVDKRVLTDRWNTPGVPAKYKSITDQSVTKPTSRFVEDINELMLSSVMLSYDFSNMKWVKRSPMEYFKITFNMSDVFWLSSVKKEQGLDYPRAHAFSFGIQARF